VRRGPASRADSNVGSAEVSTMNDGAMRRVVRDKIAAGRLPRDRTGVISATNGTDGRCDACSTPVSPEEVLVKLSYGGSCRFVFHAMCFAIWREERDGITPYGPT